MSEVTIITEKPTEQFIDRKTTLVGFGSEASFGFRGDFQTHTVFIYSVTQEQGNTVAMDGRTDEGKRSI